MKFLLNKEKSSLLIFGDVIFTFDNPGPKDIDLNANSHLVKQVIYNCRRGFLACEDPDALLAMETNSVIVSPTQFNTPIPKHTPINPQEATEEDLKPLKQLLKSKIATIKKELITMSPGRVRKLKELESNGKNRKKLIESIDKIITKHTETTKASVGRADIEGKIHAPEIGGSPNVSDIVESEVEEVKIVGSQ